MKLIQDLVDMIDEELEGAEGYIKKAMKLRMDKPDLAKKLSELAEVEMSHAEMLHAVAVAEINEYRKEHGEPPEKMLWRWEMEHEKFIDRANKTKVLIATYKNMR